MRLAILLLATAAACQTDELAQPDISELVVVMRWTDLTHRSIAVSLRHNTIPCDGVEHDFLGETGIDCRSADWRITVDGRPVSAEPVMCTSAHHGLFGFVEKSCRGGRASTQLFDAASTDVEIVATNDIDERTITLHGVRRTYTWVEEAPLQFASTAGIVRVDGIFLDSENFGAQFKAPDSDAMLSGTARLDRDPVRLEVSMQSTPPTAGLYGVRILGYADDGDAKIAVPLEGTLTVVR